MELIIFLFYLIVFGVLIYKLPFFHYKNSPKYALSFFGTKVIVLLAYIALYTFYYKASDSHGFFNEGMSLIEVAKIDFVEFLKYIIGYEKDYQRFLELGIELDEVDKSGFFMGKINALFYPFTLGSYYSNQLIITFGAFSCIWYFIKNLQQLQSIKVEQLFILFLLPNLLFWSNGLTKDALTISCLILLYTIALTNRKWILLLPILFILYFTRDYILPFYALPVLGLFLLNKIKSNKIKLTVIGFSIFIVLGLCFSDFLIQILINKQTEFNISIGGSQFSKVKIKSGFGILITFIQGLINSFFRPFPWDLNKPIQFIAFTDVLLFFSGFIYLLKKYFNQIDWSKALLFIIPSLIHLTVIGILVSNSGTLVRYRAIPLALILVGITFTKNK